MYFLIITELFVENNININEKYNKALGHYQKMYELLPSDTVNKTDFMDDILRIKNRLMEIKRRKIILRQNVNYMD